ncbi:MAG: hypothetical protein U1E35_09320 [Rhodospirillales bacterium]
MMLGLGHAPVFASLISLTPPRVGTAHADATPSASRWRRRRWAGATLTALAGLAARSAGSRSRGGDLPCCGVVLLGLYELLLGTGRRLVDRAGSGAA